MLDTSGAVPRLSSRTGTGLQRVTSTAQLASTQLHRFHINDLEEDARGVRRRRDARKVLVSEDNAESLWTQGCSLDRREHHIHAWSSALCAPASIADALSCHIHFQMRVVWMKRPV